MPREITFRLEEGTKIGGIVVDDEGKPIEGVKVSFSAGGPTSPERAQQSIYGHIVTTNSEGKWICDIVPNDLAQLAMTYVHNDYVSDHNSRMVQNGLFPKLRDMTYRRVMQTGVPVQGQVTDPDGNPIEGAVLALGRDPTGAFNPHPKPRTNKDGRYRFTNQAIGPTDITVVAKGFAPHTQRIDVRPNISPLNLQLKLGHTIRMRVLDKAGKPISGVTILPVAWRGTEALLGLYEFGIPHTTDKDGRLEWTWAPSEAVDYDIFTRNHMSIRDQSMTPREEEYVFTLCKQLDISGRVLDTETREPIKSFRLIPGVAPPAGGVSWQRSWQEFGKDGKYRYRRTIPSKGYVLRIEAPGYKPGESRVFRSDEVTVTFDFEMVRGNGPGGMIVSAAGKPVAGAEAILCKPQNGPYFRNGAGYEADRVETAKTAADGRFEFAFQTEPFAVVVVAKEGYANVSQDELERSSEIKLQPWSRVEGKLMIGAKPGANQKMSLHFLHRTERGHPRMHFDYEATTDRDGNFAFTRVPPNMKCFLARQIDLGRCGRTITHRVDLATRPGQTEKLTIGGTGRPVIGRLVSEREIEEWNFGYPSLRPVDDAAAGLRGLGQSYGFRINADGLFRIEDVPSGSYVLSLSVYRPVLRGQHWRRGELIGRLTHSFEIKRMPDGRSDQPIDLGKLKLP